MQLSEQHCVPCEGGIPPLTSAAIETFRAQVNSAWKLEGSIKIKRDFSFKDFKEAMLFVNKVAAIAEEQQHHPNIHIFYSQVTLELWTHAISGLSDNDFIMASKVDELIK